MYVFYFSPEDHVDNFIHLIDTNDNRLYRSEIHLRTRQYLIQVSKSEGDLPLTRLLTELIFPSSFNLT